MSIQTVKFPDQQTILKYYNNHPYQKEGVFNSTTVQSIAPDGIQKAAMSFANREMPFSEINKNIRQILTDQKQREIKEDPRLSSMPCVQ